MEIVDNDAKRKCYVLPSKDKEETNSGFLRTIASPDAGIALADIIDRELAKWGRYVVLDRSALDKELKLINLSEGDTLHSEDYLSLGKC